VNEGGVMLDRGSSASARRRGRRVLLYSHDTFGLGHLRRCRTIAQALAASDPSCPR
jgi:predicted glycosyltransferase